MLKTRCLAQLGGGGAAVRYLDDYAGDEGVVADTSPFYKMLLSGKETGLGSPPASAPTHYSREKDSHTAELDRGRAEGPVPLLVDEEWVPLFQDVRQSLSKYLPIVPSSNTASPSPSPRPAFRYTVTRALPPPHLSTDDRTHRGTASARLPAGGRPSTAGHVSRMLRRESFPSAPFAAPDTSWDLLLAQLTHSSLPSSTRLSRGQRLTESGRTVSSAHAAGPGVPSSAFVRPPPFRGVGTSAPLSVAVPATSEAAFGYVSVDETRDKTATKKRDSILVRSSSSVDAYAPGAGLVELQPADPMIPPIRECAKPRLPSWLIPYMHSYAEPSRPCGGGRKGSSSSRRGGQGVSSGRKSAG